MKTVIIIPARMASQRFPNKPLALIKGIPMVQRVWEQSIKSNLGDVFVACSEAEVFELITNLGGKAIMTDPKLPSGTDRIYAALKQINNFKSYKSIINLQGDMPLINPNHIIKVNQPLLNGFDMGTLATNLSSIDEKNTNITKIKIDWLKKNKLGLAKNFYKLSEGNLINVYHHVGIYSFNYDTLEKFVTLKPSKNELIRKLEQWRAIDAGINIGVSYAENVPISVDTKEDLNSIENIIENKNDKN